MPIQMKDLSQFEEVSQLLKLRKVSKEMKFRTARALTEEHLLKAVRLKKAPVLIKLLRGCKVVRKRRVFSAWRWLHLLN